MLALGLGTLYLRPLRHTDGCMLTDLAKRVEVPVDTLVHPCRVKSFREAVSAVMDDLVQYFQFLNIPNWDLIIFFPNHHIN